MGEGENGRSMVLSVSRRTDVPAFYGEWFVSRVRGGEVAVRNPVNPNLLYFYRKSIGGLK
jgi:hypothetical protein